MPLDVAEAVRQLGGSDAALAANVGGIAVKLNHVTRICQCILLNGEEGRTQPERS